MKKSPRNARKTPHSEAIIEAYAASIAAKGILQNLVVEPELDGEGTETGFYFVSVGEGRRLAQLLRVTRKQIKKTERHLTIIEAQIRAKAERMTITVRTKARQFGRFSTTWTRADEKMFRENVAALRFARRGEIDALTRKLARQTGAIAALRVRYRINEKSDETAV